MQMQRGSKSRKPAADEARVRRSDTAGERGEQRVRAAADLVGISYIDPEGRILFASGRVGQILGYPSEELIGRNIREFGFPEDEHATSELWSLRERLHAGEVQSISAEKRYRHKNGSAVHVAATITVQRDRDGKVLHDIAAIEDITARRRGVQLQALEHAVNRSLADADNASAAVRAAIRAICETEGWECGRYFRWNEKTGKLRFSDAWSVPDRDIERYVEKSRDLAYAPGVGLVGKVWQSGQPIWVADISRDSRIAHGALARDPNIRGAFAFPIISEGKTIGALAFSSREIREPDEGLIETIGVIGGQIGQFVRRKQAEEEQRRFRAAMDASADLILLVDPVKLRYIDVNDAACRTLGYTRDELLEMGPQDIFSISTEDLRALYQRLIQGDQAEERIEGWYRRKDGTRLAVESFRRALRSPDGDIIVAVARDMTEQRKREEELRRFRLAMDNSADMVVLVDRATMRFVDVNRTVCRLLGYSREELLEMGPQDLLPTSREELEKAYDTLIATPSAKTGVLTSGMRSHYRCKDGSLLPFESTRRVLRSGDSYIVAAVSRDISERIASEERMRNQAMRQRLIAEFGQHVLASSDLTEVMNHAVELVSTTLKAEYCDILECGPDRRRLVFKAAVGWPKDWVGQRTVELVRGGSLEHVLSSNESVFIEDLKADSRFSRSPLVELGVRSTVRAPILGTKEAFGVIGVHSRQVRRFTEEEVNFLRNVANILAVAIERKNVEVHLARLAQFDGLTGLPNRHLFHDRLLQAMAQAQRSKRPMAVLFIDLDRFKLVNDTLGHAAGDRLLKETAARLTHCIRSGDTAGRFGGDEFGAVLSNLGNAGDASIVAQKIIDALSRPFDLDGHETYVSASVGITLFPGDSKEAGALIMNADTAMFRAKEQGRNTYQFFTREMNERARERLRIDTALRRAMERKEFLLHYQPRVDLKSGAICGVEALLRWQHPEKGTVPPAEFIPVLEDSGLIVPIGEWVMREVCGQIGAWQKEAISVPPVAINLSARQFQQKELESTVRRILRETGIDPALLEFELTESLLMKEPETAARTLRGLKESGVKISVDDFGTGYSSLAYLRRFPIDALKIDRAFIRDVTTNPEDAAITLAIIGLAHSLKLNVVAEGVETEGQVSFLSRHDCEEVQGFFFSEPVTASECGAMLRESPRLGRHHELPEQVPAVLLLDDCEEDLTLLERILCSDGFPVLKTTDPKQAFELLASRPVAIVIADQSMPQLTGVEFLAHVRKLYPDVIRVVATNLQDPHAVVEAVNEAGVHKYLAKDWEAERVRAEVRDAYRRLRREPDSGTRLTTK
jgi:diguanylate cyclase (GGDEF)-like protein/PAS domain S-box-containing protein